MTTLKELAKAVIDGKMEGNKDQIVADFIYNKYKNSSKTEFEIDEKMFSAMKNFEETIRKINKKERV